MDRTEAYGFQQGSNDEGNSLVIDYKQSTARLFCVEKVSTVNASEAKAHLGRYLQRAKKGERIIIAERNVPVAALCALDPLGGARRLRLGVCPDMPEVPEDFNAPLTEFEADFYGS